MNPIAIGVLQYQYSQQKGNVFKMQKLSVLFDNDMFINIFYTIK